MCTDGRAIIVFVIEREEKKREKERETSRQETERDTSRDSEKRETLPCVLSKRPCHIGYGCFESTHGGVLNVHTGAF